MLCLMASVVAEVGFLSGVVVTSQNAPGVLVEWSDESVRVC